MTGGMNHEVGDAARGRHSPPRAPVGHDGGEEDGGIRSMGADKVVAAYARWAPIYDQTFGRITTAGRARAVRAINDLPPGRVLEAGVGTGISLPLYDPAHRVTGIDLSADMLRIARRRVEREGLTHVEAVREMDAGAMDFPDAAFDVAIAMYVITVVPDPDAVMAELTRVVRPGGRVMVLNHFSRPEDDRGPVARIERGLAPHGEALGWRPVFPRRVVTRTPGLRLLDDVMLPPLGLFTLLTFERE